MLAEQCMLVELVVKQWTARKLDKSVTQEVNFQKGSDSQAARVNKLVVKKEHIAPITRTVGDLRTYHYKMTMPYMDKGARLLTIGNHYDYTSHMNSLIANFKGEVDHFITHYYTYIREAQERFLGNLYDPNDYPDAEIIRSRFLAKIAFSPVPDGNTLDKLAGFDKAEIEKIKKQVREHEEERLRIAMADLWTRLHDGVNHMAKKLSEEREVKGEVKAAVFRDSLVGNLCDLVDLLPRMNITNDQNLERMRREVEAKLCTVDIGSLREDNHLRKEVAKDAKELADQMAIYF